MTLAIAPVYLTMPVTVLAIVLAIVPVYVIVPVIVHATAHVCLEGSGDWKGKRFRLAVLFLNW
jgi:hypothetical protein